MLTRPILSTTVAFDATQEKAFIFTASGSGSQIVANQLTIRDQESNQIIYQAIQNTFKFEHILPASTLKNGGYYNATIATLDALGNKSPESMFIQFSCYSTPTIKFNNIPATHIINNASFDFSFTYEQVEGEKLNSYLVNLYNASQIMISSSRPIYVQNGTPPYTASYPFVGLEDNTVYYIEVIGETLSGMRAETGKAQVEVSYIKPNLFTLLSLKNNCDEGYISVTSNISLITGSYFPDPPVFIDGKEIDLRGEKDYIEWDNGYTINGDFLARAWFRNPNPWSTIIQFSNVSGQTIKINYMQGYKNVVSADLQSYIEVYVESLKGQEYYIFSNYIDTLPQDKYYVLQFRRINNIYQVGLLN